MSVHVVGMSVHVVGMSVHVVGISLEYDWYVIGWHLRIVRLVESSLHSEMCCRIVSI
jgi:hypothetical protein